MNVQSNLYGRKIISTLSAILYLIPAICSISCTTAVSHKHYGIDFTRYHDEPLPSGVADWIKGGTQSQTAPEIAAIASKLTGSCRRELLYKAVDYVWTNFKYDNWYGDKAFARTADQLFKSWTLGGCSDFALVQAALFRALKIPSRLVITANVDWMLAFQKNDLLISTGHVFIEAFLEDRWFLVDSTYRFIFTDYNIKLLSYPRREYFAIRCKDYWEQGINNISKLDNIFHKKALNFKKHLYTNPDYHSEPVRLF